MASPIGHYLFGLSIGQAFARDSVERRQAFWLATIACLPDLDVIPGLLVGSLAMFHRSATHSILAALIFALIAGQVFRWWRWQVSVRFSVLLFLLYGSHLLLDCLTLDTGYPYGVPLFWPWNHETYQSPWAVLPNVQHTRAPLVSIHNVLLVLRESIIFLPLLGLIQALKNPPLRSARLGAWFYGGWFLVATGASILLLQRS
jgi:membrane-bound metal-dependent hydrolase YbcI (DUF457 family)